VTGFHIYCTEGLCNPKRFDAVRWLVPKARTIALLLNPNAPSFSEVNNPALRTGGRERIGDTKLPSSSIIGDSAFDDCDFDAAFAYISQHHASTSALSSSNADASFFFAAARTGRRGGGRVTPFPPRTYELQEFVAHGGRISYDPMSLSLPAVGSASTPGKTSGLQDLRICLIPSQPTKMSIYDQPQDSQDAASTQPAPTLLSLGRS